MGKSLPSEFFLASAVSVAALSRGHSLVASARRASGAVARIASASGTCEARISF